MHDISQATLDKLREYDTPTICNVIELFDVQPRTTGYMSGTIKAAFPEMSPIVGFAATATMRTTVQRRGEDSYMGLPDQVERFSELSGPAIVVFQDLDAPDGAATFGEVMTSTYKAFGAIGLIVDGAGRDLDQVRELDFPVFTNGIVCSHGYNHTLEVHVPIKVGGIAIYPDDLLHGDLNGVTTIPKEIAADIADACAEFVAAEKVIIDLAQSGSPTVAQLREATAEKKRLTNILQQRLSRQGT